MESKNLDKALLIYSKLISGEEVSKRDSENGQLYEEYYSNAEVYDIVGSIFKKLNLCLYEYNDSLYVTAGEGNRVFGYTNDDVKRMLGLRLNKELYLCYFIMYMMLIYFYRDSESYQFRDYIKPEKVIGTNTRDGIQSGVIRGYVGQVDYILRQIEKELGVKQTVVATGGMSNMIASETDRINYVNPTLTLEGLARIYDMNR